MDTAVAADETGRRVRHAGLALAVILCCQLMVVLDTTIVNIALPRIQDGLNLTTSGLSWVVNAYTLAFGGLLLLGGRAGDILGRRRVLIAGMTVFTVAAAAGGVADGAGWLMAARAVQGVGAAVAAPTALGLIAVTFPEGPERKRALGVFSIVSGGSMALGLVVGGLLASVSWRWVLWVNVPFGVAAVILAPLVLPESPRRPGRLDVTGALLSALGPILLVYGFIAAPAHGWLDPVTLGSFTAAVLLLAAFVAVESRAAQPIVPLRLFASRDRTGAYLMRLLLTASMAGMTFFATLFMQDVLRVGPLWTGLAFMPSTVALVIAGRVVAGRWTARRPALVVGAALTTAGMLWLTTVSPHSSYLSVMLAPTILTGFGVGLLFVVLTVVVLADVPADDAGAASGVLQSMQQTGGSLGVAIQVTAYEAARHAYHDQAYGMRGAFIAGTALSVLLLVIALAVIRRQPAGSRS